MKIKLIIPLIFILWSCATNPPKLTVPEDSSAITATEISDHIRFLASDELKGRLAGAPESEAVIDYIINQFKGANILPADGNDYHQYFNYVNNIALGQGNSLAIGEQSFQVSRDYIPLGFSSSGEATGGVAFCGYGFSISDSIQWNDYSGADVTGKWVLLLRGGPEGDSPHSPYEAHLPLRKKVLLARDQGAAGVLFVSPFEEDQEDELIPLRYDQSFSGAGIPVIHIKQALADTILSQAGKKLKQIQNELQTNQQPNSFVLENITASAKVELIKQTVRVANVVGVIPGSDPVLKNEYIALGAHFDHLGMGGPGSGSLRQDTVAVHNGADDNASGTAALLELGEKLSAERALLKRSVLLLAFNGEEEGLLGSKYFVKNPIINLKNIVTMINMDMVGRLNENKISIGGTGTNPEIDSVLKEVNSNYGLDLKMSPEGYGPSDHASFYTNNIPVLFFFTGIHNDYHRPSDDWEKINVSGEKEITEFIHAIVLKLDQAETRPQFAEAGPKEAQGPRRRFKVTFGVLPSYGSQAVGMEIDGTKRDGPAAKAGMQKGDIIIEIEGKEIKNIYDYMYRLADLKKGQTILVKVRRGEEIVELQLEL
ncbi:MAG: M28 family peptidase [Fidelibacterota bacterium]